MVMIMLRDATTETAAVIATLRAALPDLRAQLPIRSLAIFGSRARGDARPDSDLDVLVEFSEPVSLSKFLALEEQLGKITGLRIDLVTTASLKPHIGSQIRQEAIAL